MGIDLTNGYEDLLRHANHDIECVTYGGTGTNALNVAVECVTCSEVLIDFDRPDAPCPNCGGPDGYPSAHAVGCPLGDHAPAQSAQAEPGNGGGGKAEGRGGKAEAAAENEN